jgi:hypothetical protein
VKYAQTYLKEHIRAAEACDGERHLLFLDNLTAQTARGNPKFHRVLNVLSNCGPVRTLVFLFDEWV